jgi:hypothetical protein
MKDNQASPKASTATHNSNDRVRKAHFAENPVVESAYETITNQLPPHKNNSNNSNTTTNNKHKQKKQKTNNTTNTSNNNNNKSKSKGKTTAFASAPPRKQVRIKNSRAATLARSKARSTNRQGSTSEVIFAHKTRFDVNFGLSATTFEGRQEELKQKIDEVLNILTTADPSARLLPWKTAKQSTFPAITTTDETSGSFADIYLNRSWLGNLEQKHRLYFKIYVGHDEDYNDVIVQEFDAWSSHPDQNLKHCMIQAEETALIGWLLYSTQNIDLGSLSDAIYDELKLEVGLKWMDIRLSNKGTKSKAKQVKAIHVEVEKNKSRKITESLMKIYGRSFESIHNFPLGIRLRFCKTIDNAAYMTERTKLIKLRGRQHQLVEETSRATSAGIIDLEALLQPNSATDEPTTLRMAIMAIESRESKTTPLFRSVDISYNSEEYVFAFHKSMTEESKAMVDYLYPYLAHKYTTKSLKKGFDACHIKEMESFKYNLSKDRVEDTYAELSYIAMEDDKLIGDVAFAEFDLSAMSIDDDTKERPAASILGKMYGGNDSISTQQHRTRNRQETTTIDNNNMLECTEEELGALQKEAIKLTQMKDKTSARKTKVHIPNTTMGEMLLRLRNNRAQEQGQPSNDIIDIDDDDSEVSSEEDSSDDDNDEDGYNTAAGESSVEEDNEYGEYQDSPSTNITMDIDEDDTPQHAEEDKQEQPSNHSKISQSQMVGTTLPTTAVEGSDGY